MCSADTTFSFMKCLLFYRIVYCVIELEVEFDIGKAKLKRTSFCVKVLLLWNTTDGSVSKPIGLKSHGIWLELLLPVCQTIQRAALNLLRTPLLLFPWAVSGAAKKQRGKLFIQQSSSAINLSINLARTAEE